MQSASPIYYYAAPIDCRITLLLHYLIPQPNDITFRLLNVSLNGKSSFTRKLISGASARYSPPQGFFALGQAQWRRWDMPPGTRRTRNTW